MDEAIREVLAAAHIAPQIRGATDEALALLASTKNRFIAYDVAYEQSRRRRRREGFRVTTGPSL